MTSNRTNASNGSTVTLTVTPDSGYVLDALTVTDSRGNEIKLTAQGGNKYTFTMPSRAVTVKASFVPLPDDTQKPCDGGADCPSHGFTAWHRGNMVSRGGGLCAAEWADERLQQRDLRPQR